MQGSGDTRDPYETLARAVPGQVVLGRYRLERVLGRGGFGIVWLARDTELEMDVAIKFLSDLIVSNPEAIDDLKRETRYSLKLTHPNIVRIYGFVQGAGFAGVSMEYVDGGTLSALKIQRPDRCFDVQTLAPLVEKLCDALDYAHTKVKIAHRDMKPGNLMVDSHGELKVADFGISRSIADTQTALTRISTSGTPAFMSPQQLMGEPARVTDDIYSVGATLFDLLAGKPPFYQGDVVEQLRSARPASIAQRRTELGIEASPVPREWEETIAACLEKDPSARPQSAAEIAARLGLRAPASRATTPLGVATVDTPVEPTSGRSTPPDNRLSTPQGTVRLPVSEPVASSARGSGDARGDDARGDRAIASPRPGRSRALFYAGGGVVLVAAAVFAVLRLAGGGLSGDESLARIESGDRGRAQDARSDARGATNAASDSAGSELLQDSGAGSSDATGDDGRPPGEGGVAARIQAIEAALSAGDYDGAQREMTELRTQIPGDPRLVVLAERIEEGRDVFELRRRINRQLTGGDYAAASTSVRRLLRLRPDDAEARTWQREIAEKLDTADDSPPDGGAESAARSETRTGGSSLTDTRTTSGSSGSSDPGSSGVADGRTEPDGGSGDASSPDTPANLDGAAPGSPSGDATTDTAVDQGILSVVSSYHRALQELDIDRFAALWLDPGKTKNEFGRAFRDVKSQSIEITEPPQVERTADTAIVRLRDRRRQVMQVGPTFENEFEVLMRIRMAGGVWKIEKVELRARS